MADNINHDLTVDVFKLHFMKTIWKRCLNSWVEIDIIGVEFLAQIADASLGVSEGTEPNVRQRICRLAINPNLEKIK